MYPLFYPYRVKNPRKRFPIATVSLIALNVLVYFCTIHYTLHGLLPVRQGAVDDLAFQLGKSSFFTIISSIFLHANFEHIAGNMLFFWVFAPPVEDRMGIPKFLLMYLISGIVGGLLQGLVGLCIAGHALPCLGASGCIMGVMGAYWYMFSWSKISVAYCIILLIIPLRWGLAEIKSFWFIGAFLLINLLEGLTHSVSKGGTGNFAHIGGMAIGILACWLFHMQRDTAQVSEVKATHAEQKDLTLLTLAELEIMRDADPQDPAIMRAMLPQITHQGNEEWLAHAFRQGSSGYLEKDPALVAQYLLEMHGDITIYQPTQLMSVAQHVETSPDPRQALKIYQLIRQQQASASLLEMVLYREARCAWDRCQDAAYTRACLQELLKRFPYGSMEQHAKMLLKQVGNG